MIIREKKIEVSTDSIIIISGVLKAIQLIVVWLLKEAHSYREHLDAEIERALSVAL